MKPVSGPFWVSGPFHGVYTQGCSGASWGSTFISANPLAPAWPNLISEQTLHEPRTAGSSRTPGIRAWDHRVTLPPSWEGLHGNTLGKQGNRYGECTLNGKTVVSHRHHPVAVPCCAGSDGISRWGGFKRAPCCPGLLARLLASGQGRASFHESRANRLESTCFPDGYDYFISCSKQSRKPYVE